MGDKMISGNTKGGTHKIIEVIVYPKLSVWCTKYFKP